MTVIFVRLVCASIAHILVVGLSKPLRKNTQNISAILNADSSPIDNVLMCSYTYQSLSGSLALVFGLGTAHLRKPNP